MRWPLSAKKTAVIAFFLLICSGVFAFTIQLAYQKPTYIRIVDKGTLAQDKNSTSPGADIRGVSIQRNAQDPFYIHEIISYTQSDNGMSGKNQYSDARVIIGDVNDSKKGHVALSYGGEIIVRIDASYAKHDTITVYEIGLKQGRTAEFYDVYIGTSAEGPWTLLGTGSGESLFTIQD